MKIIDTENWPRKEYYELFSGYDEPFFGLTAEVDCTMAYDNARKDSLSFFACYLQKSLAAANEIPEFKYRVDNKRIVLYDMIHASTTIGREDGTFGFGFIEYDRMIGNFNEKFTAEAARIRSFSGLGFDSNAMRSDVIHYTSIPWLKFTGMTHARNFKRQDSIPKISFGKAEMNGGRLMMPVSVFVHHGLADGLHVAKFFELFQNYLDEKQDNPE